MEALTEFGTGEYSSSVIGFVSPQSKVLTSTYHLVGSTWEATVKEPTVFFPEVVKPMFLAPKRFMALIGGRGSGKTLVEGDHGLVNMHDLGRNMMCIREFQSSVSDSVHAVLSSEISRLELDNADVTERTIKFTHNNAMARFMGLSRNPESVKSAFGFLDWWVEEAQFLSEKSLRVLTPTARKKPKKGLPGKQKEIEVNEVDMNDVRMVFCANPASSEDPFSKRFIVPFKSELDTNGIYEDDLHLIIKMNWSENPWFSESGLEAERQFDFKNLPRSTYDWVWEGGFNDEIENGLIKPEWFDACIDAHIKLGMKEFGISKVTHDPSDLGNDPKATVVRRGNVITNVMQRTDLDVNDGSDWALGVAINENADQYEWDVGGLGLTLKRDVNNALASKRITVHQFNGAAKVDHPKTVYESSGASNIVQQKTWEQVCKNLRAQCYLKLRDRVYRTFKAVSEGVMTNPDELISFSSTCESLTTLRAELCRMPIKPRSDGLFELYTKKEMREKFKVRSPNCADGVMMSERIHAIINDTQEINFTSFY
ncbi:phage terminase large subunit [bacterium]|nr:phage terminase large subunit [bacterium]